MLNIYDNLLSKEGTTNSGIKSIKVRESQTLQERQFTRQHLFSGNSIITGNYEDNFYEIDFIKTSFDHIEKSKKSKAGTYYDITINATSNNLDPMLLQLLNTLRYKKLAVLLTYCDKSQKLIGDQNNGMQLEFQHNTTNKNNLGLTLDITLTIQKEFPTSFIRKIFIIYAKIEASTSGGTGFDPTGIYQTVYINLYNDVNHDEPLVMDGLIEINYNIHTVTTSNGGLNSIEDDAFGTAQIEYVNGAVIYQGYTFSIYNLEGDTITKTFELQAGDGYTIIY
jgi:hypothetical protein